MATARVCDRANVCIILELTCRSLGGFIRFMQGSESERAREQGGYHWMDHLVSGDDSLALRILCDRLTVAY